MQTLGFISANQITAVSTASLVIVGILTVWYVRKQMSQSLEPVLTIYAIRRGSFIWIVVKNIGRSVAHDVRVDIPGGLFDSDGVPVDIEQYQKGIPSLAPGTEYSLLWSTDPLGYVEKKIILSKPSTLITQATTRSGSNGNRIVADVVVDIKSFSEWNGQNDSQSELSDAVRSCHSELSEIARKSPVGVCG